MDEGDGPEPQRSAAQMIAGYAHRAARDTFTDEERAVELRRRDIVVETLRESTPGALIDSLLHLVRDVIPNSTSGEEGIEAGVLWQYNTLVGELQERINRGELGVQALQTGLGDELWGTVKHSF